jgi:signal transduction histidine kinase
MPLRIKLVQRETIIAHQEKLANFEQLAAGLAHEIRNPLTAINARLYTVQRKLPEGSPEHKDAVVIRDEIGRVNQILKDFIQLTRPAAPNLVVMTAESLLKDVSDLMAAQLQRQAIRLEGRSQGQARFNGDAQQLKQVLINLIQNAAQSIGRDGLIILRSRDGSATLKGTQTKVAIIEVEDDGPGIRPEVQGRLFDPFFSTRKGGTGLGLPISARIIDRHGGRLDFETETGQRTVFRITLPAYEE